MDALSDHFVTNEVAHVVKTQPSPQGSMGPWNSSGSSTPSQAKLVHGTLRLSEAEPVHGDLAPLGGARRLAQLDALTGKTCTWELVPPGGVWRQNWHTGPGASWRRPEAGATRRTHRQKSYAGFRASPRQMLYTGFRASQKRLEAEICTWDSEPLEAPAQVSCLLPELAPTNQRRRRARTVLTSTRVPSPVTTTGFGLTAGLHRPANDLGRPLKLSTFRRWRPITGFRATGGCATTSEELSTTSSWTTS